MKKQSPPFESLSLDTERTQPDYIRDLLEAGRDAATNDPTVRGYDVEAGIARHAALVQAGAPLPPWAEQLVASGSGAAAGAGAATVAKLATGKLVAGVALAVVAAGTIAAMVIGAPEKTAHVAPARAPVAPVAPQAAPQAATPDDPPASAPSPAAHEAAQAGDAVEILDIAPITARAKRDLHSGAPAHDDVATDGRTSEVQSKTARGNGQSTKSLDALIEAVGKGKPSSKGHVDLVAPSEAVARSESQVRPERASNEQAAATPAPAPVVDDARLEREMGMLAVAQRVLKSDPARALRLAQQGEKEFAGSMFTQERQQVLLLALIELGRIGEAKRLALPYLKRYPNGPFSDRLRTALAAAKPEN